MGSDQDQIRDNPKRQHTSFFPSLSHWMEQFPPVEALDESPRLRLVIVIILFVFLSRAATVGAAVSGTVTHDAPGSPIATTAAASTNDEDVVAADGSTRAPRLAEDVLLLFPVAATTACRLRRLFDCGDCDVVTAANSRMTSRCSRSTGGVLSGACVCAEVLAGA